MYEANNKIYSPTLDIKRSGFKSIVLAALSLTLIALPVLFSATENAEAGELYKGHQTLRKQTGLGARRISPSTKAVKALNNAHSEKSLDIKQSSPYEARMVAYNTAMRKYDKDYAKWEYKTDQIQAKQEKKAEKERQKDQAKRKKEQEKLAKAAAREQEKIDRKNKASSKSSPTSFLARAFGGKEAAKDENKTVIADEKAKKAEAFFGSVESDSTTALATEAPAKPKLSFWQRLSRALFGGK